jgi:hypothetical protein
MAALSAVASVSFILQLAAAIAAGATSATAYKGYRATGSSTFLRLFACFALLALGLLAAAVSLEVDDATLSIAVMITGSALEAGGYFLLALSHFFTVRRDITTLETLLLIPAVSVSALMSVNLVLRAVSLYLLFYISAETLIFYFQNRRSPTLISVSGLLLITLGVLLDMVLQSASDYALTFNVLKLLGFVLLFSPVTILLRRRPEVPLK